VALQYVIKNYLHVQNTKYFNERKVQKKFKHKNNLQQFFLTTSTISWGWNFSLYPTSSPIEFKWNVPKNFKFLRSSIINILWLEYFFIKSFSWSLNKGNSQGVLTWEMHGGPSTTSIVVLMWILKVHVTTTLHKL
jgi:hypothetical protein